MPSARRRTKSSTPAGSARHRAVNLVAKVDPLAAAGEADRGRPPLRRRARDHLGGVGVAAGPGIARPVVAVVVRRAGGAGHVGARAGAEERAPRGQEPCRWRRRSAPCARSGGTARTGRRDRAPRPSRSPARRARRAGAPRRPAATRARSRSSTRITNAPPRARASSQASSAVRALPRWSWPVGLGAKRPRGTIGISRRSSDSSAHARPGASRPSSSASSTTNAAAGDLGRRARAPARRVACAVPPVASRSSTIATRAPATTASACISSVSVPYSSA